MFLAIDDNPAKLDGSYTDLQCCARIELCNAKPSQFTALAFRFAILMHLPITSDRRQATAKRIHDLLAIVRSTAEYKS